MAGTTTLSELDLLCPQCSGIYCLPVLLKCGHNICRVCLQKFWEWKGCRECPVCGTVCVLGRPPINLALKLAADKYQARRTTENNDVCYLHEERLNMFCQNDEELVCFVCKTSKQHKVHECWPVDEAAQQKKTEVSSMLESLRKKLKMLNKTKDLWEETKKYIQIQAHQTEKAIKEEFEKLHMFLLEEEFTRLKALQREEEIKTQVMREKLESIKIQIQTLTSAISDAEEALRAKDLPFLQDYKRTKKCIKPSIRDPECIRDILINSANYLGSLKFVIWRKMADIISCVPITLDPNTAQSNLKFSDEFTSVQYTSKQLVPDNPERCTNSMCVLGATGFTSGKHRWTVEVGKGKNWHIGVVRESIKRKSTVFLNPTEGFWAISLCSGDTYWAEASPRTKLVLKQKPEKITVKLDYDKGKVVFINAADLTTIHTFHDKFTERIFPYFSPGMYDEDKTSSPLKICPQTITVDVD